MLDKGLELMVAGMGVVFLFLILMVIVMHLSSSVLKRFEKALPAQGRLTTSNPLALTAIAIAAARRHLNG
jgi:oxaloacetate decarboxylase (Na+ extruding) subunit gamma